MRNSHCEWMCYLPNWNCWTIFTRSFAKIQRKKRIMEFIWVVNWLIVTVCENVKLFASPRIQTHILYFTLSIEYFPWNVGNFYTFRIHSSSSFQWYSGWSESKAWIPSNTKSFENNSKTKQNKKAWTKMVPKQNSANMVNAQ